MKVHTRNKHIHINRYARFKGIGAATIFLFLVITLWERNWVACSNPLGLDLHFTIIPGSEGYYNPLLMLITYTIQSSRNKKRKAVFVGFKN